MFRIIRQIAIGLNDDPSAGSTRLERLFAAVGWLIGC